MLRITDPELGRLLALLEEKEDFVFLDTSRPDPENIESLLFLNPVERLVCKSGDDLEGYLATLEQRLHDGYYLAGWIGYEFGAILEAKLGPEKTPDYSPSTVLADLGVFLKPYRFDHHTGQNDFPIDSCDHVEPGARYTVSGLCANMNKKEFVEALQAVRDYIGAGDTYQVNYTMKLLFDFAGSTGRLYTELRRNQSVAYGAYIGSGSERILSFSPELFFRKKGNEITVRPMKGTARIGKNLRQRQEIAHFLHNDVKNRSENVMIVDLLRNDLGRLIHGCRNGRVFVDSLFDVESYESLLQMTSTIKAQASIEVMGKISMVDLFRALFPCGSITGAPKIRTMEIIAELEKAERGVYTGAIGYFAPDGAAVFNVPIRTVRLHDGKGEMGIGAGITYDSKPEDEWDESLLKGRFLTHRQPRFQLFETLLWSRDGGYWLLEEHLERLAQGADYFQYVYDKERIRATLAARSASFTSDYYRVRLTLEKDGRMESVAQTCTLPACTTLPLVPETVEPSRLPGVSFSWQRTNSEEPWLYYKTTRRELYNEEYRRAGEQGLADYLFVNEAGELTESCIANIIIFDGQDYYTPPVSCGLLAGVLRHRLLAGTEVRLAEKVLYPEDVATAEAIYLANSVRGLVRVRLVTEDQ